MKVLWVLNMLLPSVAKKVGLKTSFSGSWLIDYANLLSKDKDIELATITYAKVDKFTFVEVDGIKNYIFPGGGKKLLFNSKKTIENCQYVLDDFKPDLIHLHGTEYAIGYSMIKTQTKIPILLTIQGILTRIAEEYYAGLSTSQILKMDSLKTWFKLKSTYFIKKLYLKNAKRERYVLQNVKYVTGRTTWDKAVMLSINDQLKYYRLFYNLRDEFYKGQKWDSENYSKHLIFTGAASYPLKGLHILIRALEIVKKSYPDVKILVPGHNPMVGKKSGYGKFILKLIKKYDLQNNVEFIGTKNSQEMVDTMLNSSMCVIPSAIEGASATIREATMLGVPCICSYRGGMTDLLKDGISGFYYDFPEYAVLAERICNLFGSKELCEKFSNNCQKDSSIMHDRYNNFNQLKLVYKDVVCPGE